MANGKVQAPNTILMMLWHDNYIGDLSVGQVIPQGQKFYDEGTKGYATCNLVHLEISYGTYSGYTLFQLNNGF